MSNDEILRLLEEQKPLIDATMKKFMPETLDNRSVERLFGPARYAYDIGTLNKALAEPAWDFLGRGGKRWRPGLFLLTVEALGADPARLADFSVIPELAHNGSLIVDDIEDGGEMRRGRPALHKLYGIDVAINLGNLLYFLPAKVFIEHTATIDPKTLLAAYNVFSQEMINIHLGQGTDIWWHKGRADGITEDQYLQMCACKTGCLSRMAVKLAAVLSGAPDTTVEKLGRLGEAIGIAFQIQDDILSASGGEFSRKKGFGDDITEGKRSLLVIHTLEKATPQDRRRLLEILNMHTRDQKLIQEALDLLHKYKAVEYAKNRAQAIVLSTWKEADPLLPASSAKKKLEQFARFAIEREM